MAATGILPTTQRYVNGVPLSAARKTLRMKEKYVILLVFVTFGTVCFGAIFFLPDLRERVNVIEMRKHMRNVDTIIFPKPGEDSHKSGGGKILRHDVDNGIDSHKIDDKVRLQKQIEIQWEQDKIAEAVGKRLNMSKDDTLKVKGEIQDEKEKILQKKREEQEQLDEEKKEKLKEVQKDHEGGFGGQGGQPKDKETAARREEVKQV